MKKVIFGKLAKAMLDARVVVGLCGAVLSILAHELFHVITHWTNIQSVRIFPDGKTIMEVVATTPVSSDLLFEETIAYTITIFVILLTIMLVCDISDSRDNRSVRHTLLSKNMLKDNTHLTSRGEFEYLSSLLGVQPN